MEAGNGSDGFVEDNSRLGDRIVSFIAKYSLVEFTVCAVIFLFACLYNLMRWNKRRREHRLEEELPVSTSAKFIVVPRSAFARTASVADAGDGALDRSKLASMPTFVYSARALRLEPCAICSMGFKDGEKGRLLRPCFHVFHVGCSDKWFRSNSTCRVCGAAVGALEV